MVDYQAAAAMLCELRDEGRVAGGDDPAHPDRATCRFNEVLARRVVDAALTNLPVRWCCPTVGDHWHTDTSPPCSECYRVRLVRVDEICAHDFQTLDGPAIEPPGVTVCTKCGRLKT